MKKLEVTEMNRMSVDEFRNADKTPLVVVLDNVRSMHNVGSVLRTADAFRVERVFMCGITSTPPHPELHKTALGAEDSVSWEHADDTLSVVCSLKSQGYTVYAVEQCQGSVMLNNFQYNGGKVAIVFGNEVHGVQQKVVDQCHACIEIPQFGTKHSLNVSVTAGIVIWDIAKRILSVLALCMACTVVKAQTELIDSTPLELDYLDKVMPTWHMLKELEFYDGEWIPVIVLPEIPVYGPLKFRSRKQQEQYTRLVRNVKKVLPLAKQANAIIKETYEVLELLPDGKSRKRHMSSVESSVKKQFTPQMKKLTYSQGKLLIKLIDRECNQTSYEIVQAFLGPTKAIFYQVFAWTFRASLKKHYEPDGDDRMVERVVRLVEVGAL